MMRQIFAHELLIIFNYIAPLRKAATELRNTTQTKKEYPDILLRS